MAKYDITAVGTKLQFTQNYGRFNNNLKYDDNYFINICQGVSDYGVGMICKSFYVNPGNKAISEVAFYYHNETTSGAYGYDVNGIMFDDIFVGVWRGTSNYNTYAQSFEVNPTTKEISSIGNQLQIGSNQNNIKAIKYDNSRFLVLWTTVTGTKKMYLQNYYINPSNKNINNIGSTASILSNTTSNIQVERIDDNYFLTTFVYNSKFYVQFIYVNPSDKIATFSGNSIENSSQITFIKKYNNYIIFFMVDGVQLVSCNTTNNEIIFIGTKLIYEFNRIVLTGVEYKENYYILFFNEFRSDSKYYFCSQIYYVNPVTKEVSLVGEKLTIKQTNGRNPSINQYTENSFILFWGDDNGYAQIFEVEDDIIKSSPSNLMMMGIG